MGELIKRKKLNQRDMKRESQWLFSKCCRSISGRVAAKFGSHWNYAAFTLRLIGIGRSIFLSAFGSFGIHIRQRRWAETREMLRCRILLSGSSWLKSTRDSRESLINEKLKLFSGYLATFNILAIEQFSIWLRMTDNYISNDENQNS